MDDSASCKICFTKITDFQFKPCACNDYIHKECLERWMDLSGKKMCQICLQPFIIKKETFFLQYLLLWTPPFIGMYSFLDLFYSFDELKCIWLSKANIIQFLVTFLSILSIDIFWLYILLFFISSLSIYYLKPNILLLIPIHISIYAISYIFFFGNTPINFEGNCSIYNNIQIKRSEWLISSFSIIHWLFGFVIISIWLHLLGLVKLLIKNIH